MKKRWIVTGILFCILAGLLLAAFQIEKAKGKAEGRGTVIQKEEEEKPEKEKQEPVKETGLEFKGFDKLEPGFAKAQIETLQQLMSLYLQEYEDKTAGTVTYLPDKTIYEDKANIILSFAVPDGELTVYYDMLWDIFSFTENKIILKKE